MGLVQELGLSAELSRFNVERETGLEPATLCQEDGLPNSKKGGESRPCLRFRDPADPRVRAS